MIVSEYHQSDHFDEIENELVNRLDSLFMSDSKGDDVSRAFFVGQLRHLFESSDEDERLRERVGQFLDSVDLFLELLLSVRALPEGEEFADDRVIATVSAPGTRHHIVLTPDSVTAHEFYSPHWTRRDLHQICASACQCNT